MLVFFPYYGGKTRLVKTIISMFPHHRCYVEPFGGAASVLLNKPPSQIEVYNDIYNDLVNLFYVVKNYSKEFFSSLKWELYSRKIYAIYISDLKKEEAKIGDVERAAKFYYIICSSMGGFVNPSSGNWAHSKTRNDVRRFFGRLDKLEKIYERLKNVQIECRDWCEVIDIYDGPETMFYLDPPYFGTDNKHIIDFKDENEHYKLRDRLDHLKGRFLLTYNNHPKIRKLYSGFKIKEISTQHSAGLMKQKKKKILTHLIITNY